jgi:hypothetical protein
MSPEEFRKHYLGTFEVGRQTGRTVRQMMAAHRDSTFVWCNGHLEYPKRLAAKVGREDLKIVSPYWLEEGRWRGLELTDLLLDHATELSARQMDAFNHAITRIRK